MMSVNVPATGHSYEFVCDKNCEVCGEETNPNATHVGLEDLECDDCGEFIIPAADSTITITQAIALAKHYGTAYSTAKWYITGTIKNVYNTTYGNMYIVDEAGNELCIYGLYTWDKDVRYDKMTYKPVKGDELTVYTVLGMYSTTCQGKDAWLDEVVAHEHNYSSVVTAPTCLKDGYTTHTCSICSNSYTDSKVEALGHTTDNGVCENCGLTIGGSAPKVETTVSKTVDEMCGIAGLATTNGTVVDGKEISIDNNVSVVFSKGNASTAPAYYYSAIRLYQNGALLTITGSGIKTIVITLDGSSAGDGPIAVTGGTASALTNYVYTITVDEDVSEVVIKTTGTDKNSRVYVSSISVTYEQ